MSKIVVKPNKLQDISMLLNQNIDGIIFPIENLSVESSFFIDIDEVINLKTSKEKIVLINKIMHNNDLEELSIVLNKVKTSDISKIMFYDLSVYTLCKKLNIDKELVIYQEHLNRSINSNNFYNSLGINYSYISSDITYEEIKQIKGKTNMKLFYLVYGRIPLFCSRRYLLSNYFKYINNNYNKGNYYIKNKDNKLYISEEDNATIIYSDIVNLINEDTSLIDYKVLDFNNIDNYNILDDFINNRKYREGLYLGFYNTKTTFKVK